MGIGAHLEEEIKKSREEQEEEVIVTMLSFRRLFKSELSSNLFPQSLLLSQFSPGLVALAAVSVLTCAAITNDEVPALQPPNVSTPQVANVQPTP